MDHCDPLAILHLWFMGYKLKTPHSLCIVTSFRSLLYIGSGLARPSIITLSSLKLKIFFFFSFNFFREIINNVLIFIVKLKNIRLI